jgi:hypothetical protein
MTPTDFRAALKALGLKQRDLMRLLQSLSDSHHPDAVTVNRWATGRAAVPAPVAAFLAVWAMLPEETRDRLELASRC